jgi:hypothetical protein
LTDDERELARSAAAVGGYVTIGLGLAVLLTAIGLDASVITLALIFVAAITLTSVMRIAAALVAVGWHRWRA